jgi:hypothetical protein
LNDRFPYSTSQSTKYYGRLFFYPFRHAIAARPVASAKGTSIGYIIFKKKKASRHGSEKATCTQPFDASLQEKLDGQQIGAGEGGGNGPISTP